MNDETYLFFYPDYYFDDFSFGDAGTNTGYDWINLVPVNSIKEQQIEIERQQKQIEELKAIVCSIKPHALVCSNQK